MSQRHDAQTTRIIVSSLLCLSSHQIFMQMLCLCKHIIYALPYVQTQDGPSLPASLQVLFLDTGTTGTPLGQLPPPTALQSIRTAPTQTSMILPQDSAQMSTIWSSSLPASHSHPTPIPTATFAPTLGALSGSELTSLPSLPTTTGLILSLTIEPVPAKLVAKIHSNQFIEMRELQPDNLALQQHIEAVTSAIGSANQQPSLPSKTGFREIHTIQSWMSCFLTYMAVRTPDTGTRHMLTYACLILQEAIRHEGSGWLHYDRVFCKQAAIDPTIQWKHPAQPACFYHSWSKNH